MRLKIDIVPRKHLVARSDNVQDLDKPGGVCSLLAQQEFKQIVQLGCIFTVLLKGARSVMDLVDEILFGWRRKTNWRLLDMLSMRTKDFARSNFLHELKSDNTLLA